MRLWIYFCDLFAFLHCYYHLSVSCKTSPLPKWSMHMIRVIAALRVAAGGWSCSRCEKSTDSRVSSTCDLTPSTRFLFKFRNTSLHILYQTANITIHSKGTVSNDLDWFLVLRFIVLECLDWRVHISCECGTDMLAISVISWEACLQHPLSVSSFTVADCRDPHWIAAKWRCV